ncbi:hypothetical protein OOK41_22115 [Micromonospora sp. NBC_01655]|uniref:hypothetical protein n=1 Tax=Micromonospora sp. NBC_01655 TaxID=2975983 RepID=UPI00224E7FE3|nr:hypothetical protein [Micromonospora sp. NBC_01655]MCX4472975.1 hypothetical protein [Micromonospora sp. NBC_01655]
MTVDVDTDLDVAPEVTRDDERDESMHALLLRLAGSLPDRVLTAARDALAAGRRLDVVQAVAFEAVSQPLQLDADEIAAMREELALSGGDIDLGLALEELRGERPPAPWQFLSDLPTKQEDLASMVLPQDRTADPVDVLDPADQALVAAASAVPTVRAVWRAWRMPSTARPWQDPVRVVVVSVDGTSDSLPATSAQLRQVMVEAGDDEAQVEVCWAGVEAPYYQTLARSSGSLLWAARPGAPVVTARLFDGVDPVRGPWFASNRPVVSDPTERDDLLDALRGGVVIAWSSAEMPDILAPDRGDVVPMHLRTDGTWLWSEAVGYYLEHYGLAPDPQLVAHLTGDEPVEPMDEISVHRALVHLCRPDAEAVVWSPSGADDAPVDALSSDIPSPDGLAPAHLELPDVTPEARPDAGTLRPVSP